MALVDERGRLFGRLNLIDAGLGAVFLLLIPLGYSAYVLFRTPAPSVTRVEVLAPPGPTGHRLRVSGANLRPYLKATLGTTPARFLVESPIEGEVSISEDLPSGAYDLVLYNETEELTRVRDALVIGARKAAVPAGTLRIRVKMVGWFTGLDAKEAQMLANARTLARTAPVRWVPAGSPQPDIVRVGALSNVTFPLDGSFRVNAVAIVECTLVSDECELDGTRVRPGALVPIHHGEDTFTFSVDEVHSATTEQVDIRIRFVTLPDVLSSIKAEAALGNPYPDEFRVAPRFLTFEDPISGVSQVASTDVTEQVNVVRAVLRVPVQRTAAGWSHHNAPLRVGETLTFTLARHSISGLVLSLRAVQTGAGPAAGVSDSTP